MIDQSSVDTAFLEKPVALRRGVGSVSFTVTTTAPEAQRFFDQGLAYLHSYVWLEAARSFHQALRLDPQLAMAWWGLARAESPLGLRKLAGESLDKARALAARASERERRYVALLAQQREASFTLGDAKKAKHEAYKEALEKALALDPADPELWVLRGNAEEPDPSGRGQSGKMGAVAFYEAALARDPHHVGAHHYLVHAYENSGRYAEAVAHGRVYAADATEVPHAQHMLGHVLPRAGAWSEALSQFEKAETLHEAYEKAEGVRPGDDWHHQHNLELLGYVYARLGRFEDAERTFRKQTAIPMIDPRWEGLHAMLPELLLLGGRSDEALALSRRMAASGPGTGPLVGHALEAEALLQLGRRDEARAAARASEEALAELKRQKSRDAERLIETVGDYAKQARAEVDLGLGGEAAEQAGKDLVALAKGLAEDPSVDGWGAGLFVIQRYVAEAKRAGRGALAGDLLALLRRIDSAYTPAAR
jgi:tetratricopeptide (TPR) repeat protein